QAAEGIDRALDSGVDLVRMAYVARNPESIVEPEIVPATRRKPHLDTVLDERAGNGRADASARAGHERDLVLQRVHASSSCFRCGYGEGKRAYPASYASCHAGSGSIRSRTCTHAATAASMSLKTPLATPPRSAAPNAAPSSTTVRSSGIPSTDATI